MKKYIHTTKKDLEKTLQAINAAQTKAGTFHNVTVKPHKTRPEQLTITIG